LYSPKQTKVGLKLLIAVMMILVSTDLCAEKLPHYIFVLPDGYTGWIQVIFDSPGSAPLVLENDNAVLHIKNDGIIRLPIVGHVFTGSHDEFFYERTDIKGNILRVPVPANYVCTQNSGMDTCYDSDSGLSDGFTVGRATRGKPNDGTPGNSWWLFVGPPDLRKKMAKPIDRNPDPKWPYQIDVPEHDPIPGRIK
jgi:hypothetical protein